MESGPDFPPATPPANKQPPAALLADVYDDLRRLAAARIAREKPGQTLQATALVHEAYLRVAGKQVERQSAARFDDQGHFFAAAAEAMRRILIENARRKQRIKHGGGCDRADVDLTQITCDMPDEDLLALHEALLRLAADDPLKARLVELRFFAGLTIEEAASIVGISPATAKRHWRYARAWLHRQIRGSKLPPDLAADEPAENLENS